MSVPAAGAYRQTTISTRSTTRVPRWRDELSTGWAYDDRALTRLLAKCIERPSGCWEWQANANPQGYGKFLYQGAHIGAHRAAWVLLRGDIPDGLQLDHLCRNPPCVNPWHLDPVTPKVNTNRGRRANADKTQCPAGHVYSPDITYVDRHGYRHCRPCRANAAKRCRERRRHG